MSHELPIAIPHAILYFAAGFILALILGDWVTAKAAAMAARRAQKLAEELQWAKAMQRSIEVDLRAQERITQDQRDHIAALEAQLDLDGRREVPLSKQIPLHGK